MRFPELADAWSRDRQQRSVFHDLMRYRVREILLVGSLYDSFVVESDGFLTEQIYGEYSRLNLSTIPRVTSAYSSESALAKFSDGAYDLVIIMAGLDFERPLALAAGLRARSADLPILLLVLNNSSLAELDASRAEISAIDRVFVWNGYSKLLVGMIKYVEDRRNLEADVSTGLVKVILILEDSIRYYSRYLPLLYTVLLKQTQTLIEEERGVETYRLLRARARPKILLASSYEEGERIFMEYEESMLAVITDLRFQRGGRMDAEAGFAFVRMARGRRADLPVMIQSSEVGVRERAVAFGASFADKSSESLALELADFIRDGLGFGPFRFLDGDGGEISSASTIEDFIRRLGEVPDDCLERHAARDQFSTWLSARGEYRFATMLRHYTPEDFATPAELRAFLIRVVDLVRLEKSEGLVPEFDESLYADPASMTRLGSGSVGGKGRGLEFLKKMLETDQLNRDFSGLSVRVPRTFFVGIDVFEDFLERNGLWAGAYYAGFAEIREAFGAASFTEAFRLRARRFLEACHAPLALRSSGLLEDMVMLPFGGVYESWFVPNQSADPEARLEALLEGIRRVWASLFSAKARRHFEALGYSLEEERMAVVVQELAGCRQGDDWFPLLSGVAHSAGGGLLSSKATGRGIMALGPGFGSALSGGGPALLAGMPFEETSGSWPSKRTIFEVGAGSSPHESGDLRSRELSPVETRGRIALEAFTRCGAPEALEKILELGKSSFGNDVTLEFAFTTERTAVPVMDLLQIRPLPPRPVSIVRASGESGGRLLAEGLLAGSKGNLACSDFVLLACGDVHGPGLRGGFSPETLRDLDRRIFLAGRAYALILGAAPAGVPGPSRINLDFADVSHAAFVIQVAGEAELPTPAADIPVGSHFFGNMIGAGKAWLLAKPGAGMIGSIDAGFDGIDGLEGFELLARDDGLAWFRSAGTCHLLGDSNSGKVFAP